MRQVGQVQKKMRAIFLAALALAALAPEVVRASDSPDAEPIRAHHKGLLSSVNLGTRFSSLLASRGLVLYGDFQFDPVVALFFFDDRVEFLGDSIGFRDFVAGRWLRLRGRFQSVSDDPLIPNNPAVRRGYPDREDSLEAQTYAEFFLPCYCSAYRAEIDVGLAQDLSAHKGRRVELQAKAKLLSARLPGANSLLEPNVFVKAGFGDGLHNRYFYGPEASDFGLTELTYGLWLALPEDADRYYPIVQIARFETMGDRNRNASLARNHDQGWLVSFIATVGVLE